jgi:uncharacterized protein with HEPN domain
MSRRDASLRLRHMLDYGREAVVMAQGRSRSDLDADRQFNLALVRLLEIVGEAASRMTPEDRALYPDIPWLQIVGLRNRLIYGYDDVDLDILWQIITQDLPALVAKLERYLPPGFPSAC